MRVRTTHIMEVKNQPLQNLRATTIATRFLCLCLIFSMAFIGARLVMNNLIIPAHLHAQSTEDRSSINSQDRDHIEMHGHSHSHIERHRHASVMQDLVVVDDHGDDEEYSESLCEVYADCDAPSRFGSYPTVAYQSFQVMAMDKLSSFIPPFA